MTEPLRFAFFGSSIVSSYWNGACTYYRGLIRALHQRGHEVTFYEPDAYGRQSHRDFDDPDWVHVAVYQPTDAAARAAVATAAGNDVVIKTSGIGVCESALTEALLDLPGDNVRLYWDVDAPATLADLELGREPELRQAIPAFDLILTYGGGQPVVDRYQALGARQCVPIYNALDPTTHHPVPPQPRLAADLAFLGNRLPDREQRVTEFFLRAAALRPRRAFLLGGSGWEPAQLPANVSYLGHVPTTLHNAFNCSSLAVLNVSRESMAANGFSPATRVFEAAGAGACLITDAWEGLELFLTPGREVLVAQDGAEVARCLDSLDPDRAAAIGAAAQARINEQHTYASRAQQVEETLYALNRSHA